MKPQPLRSILPDGALSTDEVLRVYDQIGRACAHAGLRFPDTEEVAQDIWEWLLRTNNVALAEEVPWLGAVAQNFIRRFWRRSQRHRLREGTPLDWTREPPAQQLIREVETNDVFDRISASLPQRERRLLILIRSGHTLAEAARMLKIPRGSRAYYGRRLVEFARRQMRNKAGGSRGAVRGPMSAIPPRTAATSAESRERSPGGLLLRDGSWTGCRATAGDGASITYASWAPVTPIPSCVAPPGR